MKLRAPFVWPQDLEHERRRAIRLEWLTIAVMASSALLLYFTFGGSQAMRTAFFEDLLALIAPAAFLIATHIERRPPNVRFPFGYYRSISIAYLVGALAILAFGVFLLLTSVAGLLAGERPSIGLIVVFGHELWAGWLMLAALVYSTIPPVILGRLKTPVAKVLNDKVLIADAAMLRADWMTGIAAAVGVVGIGFGLWWLDGVAAAAISLSIVHDGFIHIRRAVLDLIDEIPRTVDHDIPHPAIRKVRDAVRSLPWVEDADVHFREEGHLISGVIYVAPRAGTRSPIDHLAEVRRIARETNWRVFEADVSLVPLSELKARPDAGTSPAPRPARWRRRRRE